MIDSAVCLASLALIEAVEFSTIQLRRCPRAILAINVRMMTLVKCATPNVPLQRPIKRKDYRAGGRCPLLPQKRTCAAHKPMSALCQ